MTLSPSRKGRGEGSSEGNDDIMCRSIIKFGHAVCGMLISVAVVFQFGGCALQRDVVSIKSDLSQRVSAQNKSTKKVEADLKAHAKKWDKDEKRICATQAELRSQLRQLQEEIRSLRGQSEQTIHLFDTSRKSGSQDIARANTKRIHRIEAYLGMEPAEERSVSARKSGKGAKTEPSKKLTGDRLYAAAKELFDKGNYDTARSQFLKFLKENPKSENADNAQFWIGETYYHQKWYEKAILEYQKVIEKYPKTNKVPSALLKQGLAFSKIGDKGNARLILKELVRKFPESTETQIAEKKLSGMK